MLILNKFYLAGFICCISVLSFAQKGSEIEEDKFRAIHWTVNEGLAHDQVSCMLKDSFGFLWIGTPNGLSRFDGSTFKNFFLLDSFVAQASFLLLKRKVTLAKISSVRSIGP